QVRDSPDVENGKLRIDAVYGLRQGVFRRLHVDGGTCAEKYGGPYAGMLKNGFVHARRRRHVQSVIAHIPDDADDVGFLSQAIVVMRPEIPQPPANHVSLR